MHQIVIAPALLVYTSITRILLHAPFEALPRLLTKLCLRGLPRCHFSAISDGNNQSRPFFLDDFVEKLPVEFVHLTSLPFLKLHNEEETHSFHSNSITVIVRGTGPSHRDMFFLSKGSVSERCVHDVSCHLWHTET